MTMQDHQNADPIAFKRVPRNKGKLTGAQPPLPPKHVWSIRTKLQIEGRTRDLAMFNLAIDSKLRGCDVVALKVEEVAPSGYAVDRATVRQKKTSPVRVDGTDSPSCRRLPESHRQKARRIYVLQPAWVGKEHHDEAIRAPRLRVDCRNRPGSTPFWYALTPSDQGDPHLPTHRQFARR